MRQERDYWVKQMIFWLMFAVTAAILLEIGLFNFRWIQSRNYEEVTGLTMELGDEWTRNDDGTYTIGETQEAVIRLSGFDCEIRNVYFKVEIVGEETAQAITYQFMATDEANAYAMTLPELVTISTETRSHITHMNLYGKSQELKIKLLDLAGETVRIDEIKLNVHQPLYISKLRILAVTILLFLTALFLPGSALYRRRYLERSYEDKLCIVLVAGLAIGLFVAFSISNPYMMYRMNNTNRQYQELAQCLLKGQFYLDTAPDSRLVSLANPYDMDVRYAEEIAYRWDVAYYEGKYYVYFGIVPCLLFYLPYYLLTGNALVNYPVVIVEEILFCLGVWYLYHVLIKKYFRKMSVALYCLMSAVTTMGCGALYLARRTDIYTVPILCALALSVWGIALWIRATGYEEEMTLKKFPLFLGSVCIALTAGCRPQFLIVAFLALPLFFGFLVEKQERKIRIRWKKNLGNLLAVAIPFVVVAAGLMYYNYCRFGSPVDFGSGYNLTTDDMTRRGFQWRRFFIGYYTYLFKLPSITLCVPFINDTGTTTLYQGSTISEMVFGGMIVSCPILLMLLFVPRMKPVLKEKKLYGVVMILIVGALIVVGADVQMSGMLQRYFADFGIWLFVAACILWMAAEETYAEHEGLVTLRRVALLLCALTCVYNILMFFAIDLDSVWEHNPALYIRLSHEIQFWR